jgi:acyl carrier protein
MIQDSAGVRNEEVWDALVASIVQVTQLDRDLVITAAGFRDDLKADSMDITEIIVAIEESLSVSVDDQEFHGLVTVGDAYELLVHKTNTRGR